MAAPPIPTSAPMRCTGTPASRISTNHAPKNRIVSPRLGCIIRSAATTTSATADSAITGRLGSRIRHDRIQATAIAKAGFRNSDGWKRIPKSSQRRAPLTSAPTIGTKNSAPSIPPASSSPPRRAFSRLTMLMAIMTAIPIACQARWR